MTTKLFERLVTKFSIKVTDLIKYLDISKATIYNYRNLENFSDIPKDKQYKIFYLFGKESEDELELVLDESDPDILAQYVNRISSILKDSIQDKKQSLSSVENLTNELERLLRLCGSRDLSVKTFTERYNSVKHEFRLLPLDLLEFLYSVGIIENTWKDKTGRPMHRSIFRNEGDVDRNLQLRIIPAVWNGLTV